MTASRPAQQAGVLLLEALIAILIFSLGILGMIGMQTASIKQATAAEDRAIAAQLANDLISRMWASNHSTLTTDFGADGTALADWKQAVTDSKLPGTSKTGNTPTITFADGPSGASGVTPSKQATILIKWQAPNDSVVHKYTATAMIK